MIRKITNLSLIKRCSVLDGLVMLEKMPIERIKALLKSDLLLMAWDWDNYENEKAQISAYLKLYSSLGGVLVKYVKPKHKWGRSFPLKSLGLSAIRREVRNALINGLYYDCDIKNAQPEIIRNLCENNNIPCPIIKRYCNDRPALLQQVQDEYVVSRDIAKDLFIRLCFFGSFVGWCLENKITDKPPLEFITLFERELKDIADNVKKENPTLWETARKKKEDSGDNRENKVLGSFFALYNQEYESRIVEAVLCYLINNTDLMKVAGTKFPVGTYEYDGIKLWKENVDSYDGGLDAVLKLLNEKTFELTGFHLEWSAKPLDDGYDLDEWLKQVMIDETPNEELITDLEKINKAINDSDCGIIETIIEILPNHFIYSVDKDDGGKGEWYGWNGNRWEKGDAPLRKAIMYEVKRSWDSILDKWGEEFKDINLDDDEEPDCNYKMWLETKQKAQERIFNLKSANGIQSCVSVAKTLMADYTLEFDAKEDLFGCENGVLDFAEECFRPYRFDDFITFSCGYNFTPSLLGFKIIDKDGNCYNVLEQDLTEDFKSSHTLIMNTYEKIFPDEELRNYFFKIISTGLSGRAIEKFFIFNGAGRNGKGLTNEFLERVFGSYFINVSPTIFSENQKTKSSAAANPEIAKLNKKRYIVSKEPQKDAPLHNSVIKDLTGGGNTSARMLHSSKTQVKLCGTNVMETNEKPPFSEAPKDADAERINDILFGSKFCSTEEEWDEKTGKTNYIYPLDAGLKEKLKNSVIHKNTMLNLLLQHLLLVKAQGYNIDFFKPESVKKRSFDYLQNSYDIHNIFKSLFESYCEEKSTEYVNWKGEIEDRDWTLPKIAGHIRKSPDFNELPKKLQKEYKADVIIEFFCKNNFYKSIVYTDTIRHAFCMKDWRLKVVEEDDVE